MAWRIGVDSGDTFIDVCLFDDSTGRIEVWKGPATPDDPARGIAQSIEEAFAHAGDAAPRLSLRTVPPDPSAGMTGARRAGSLAGFDALIGFDMGGSKTHLARLQDGQRTGEAGGAPDIRTLEIGGDSVASVGSAPARTGSRLKIGPPGAGHDRSGPTVTDANLVLQTLNPDTLLGGRLKLRPELAHAAIGALAGTLGMDVPAAAQEILSATTAGIADAIRAIPPPQEHDRGDETLVAFGGAGPLHAARLARALGIARILVPPHPGTLGALGKLLTDPHADFAATGPVDLGAEALPVIAEAFGLLRHRAAVWFSEERVPATGRRLTRSVEMSCSGRSSSGPGHELPVPDGPVTAATLETLAEEFAALHQRLHGFSAAGEKIQLVNFRVTATGMVAKPGFQPHPDAGPEAAAARTGHRELWLPEAGGWVTCPIHDRARLAAGNRIAGPALIEQADTATLVLPGMTARVEPYLSLVLEWDG